MGGRVTGKGRRDKGLGDIFLLLELFKDMVRGHAVDTR